MKITYLGTTVLLFDDGENQILFDANVTRPSIFRYLFTKFKSNEKIVDYFISRFSMNRLKTIFISHTHADHVLDLPTFSKKCGAEIYGSKSAINVAIGGGVDKEFCHEFVHGTEVNVGNFKIRVIKSIHSKPHWYNNDLGKIIDEPLIQPASKRAFKEGGSYDFYVENKGQKILIRPSFNSFDGQLDGIKADVLFLGISGITKATDKEKRSFFSQTIEKVGPKVVIPIHWDNFFAPFQSKKAYHFPKFLEQSDQAMMNLADYCSKNDVSCFVQLPLTSIKI